MVGGRSTLARRNRASQCERRSEPGDLGDMGVSLFSLPRITRASSVFKTWVLTQRERAIALFLRSPFSSCACVNAQRMRFRDECGEVVYRMKWWSGYSLHG